MELLFVRHGQGEHTVNFPESLHITDPPLTERGRSQASKLSEEFQLNDDDMIIVSPLRRTIQTALCWNHNGGSRIIIHNAIGPRMFPLLPASRSLPCDSPLSKSTLSSDFPNLSVIESDYIKWDEGINAVDEPIFHRVAKDFMDFCKSLNRKRIHIVSHDGTITSYRQFLGEESLTRQDFLTETGWHLVKGGI